MQRDTQAKRCRFPSTPLQLIWNGYIPLSSSTMGLLASIWVSLTQCASQKEKRSRSDVKNRHIKPILGEKKKTDEGRFVFFFFLELCSVMCPWRCYTCSGWNSSKMTDCTACTPPSSPSLFIFSCSLCVKKRSTEHNFQEIILLLLQTFVFGRGFKVQMYTFFDFTPLLWLCAPRPSLWRNGGRGGGDPFIVKHALWRLWESLAPQF